MLKKQIIFTLAGLAAVTLLFIFGRTVAVKSKTAAPAVAAKKAFDIRQYIEEEKNHLSATQVIELGKLENSITRGDVSSQQVTAYTRLANFWKDSSHAYEPYLYYLSEAAKLDKSEKNLTFAAQLILNNLRGETDEAKLNWKAEQAIGLFEQAIALYPNNDDLKVGLGSCYIFGKGRVGGPEETMKGIQQILGVVRKDSNNMKAQMMLGVGGYVSGQYDKAIERLQKVVIAQPDNTEAIAFLADSYAAKGDKASAIKWYEISKRLVNDPLYSKEVDERIKLLR
ncbi:MAG: tetratricopeptide repeat protein [Chitinophagaceae bacterium]|nr:tetratricopeptide repeat protein [Chitinophagaceae bacterium]MBK7122170.1 tetratricopeptide repeat protein [Chitinophagaceae bacterium]MBK7557984.1 tetratricopeptide repeat protein [Chitinophagaceae bacterium]MBK9531677.1 tetratricopeptide repeat protein [Chitinophagaceae bacterium]HQW92464.1 tetratricopeptide repeat protein [Ferruginibacter sp.]